MLSSAQRVAVRLSAQTPPRGSGPSGAAGGKRWICARDVVAHHHAHTSWTREEEWASPSSRVCEDAGVALREYQTEAVRAATPRPGVFRSGVIEMGCGLGKTYVGGELVRRTGMPAVVITQHTLSVGQWVEHLTDVVGLASVATLATVKDATMPDALVITYNALTRASRALEAHAQWMASGGAPPPEDDSSLLLWLLHCEEFGALVLDEVHLAAADHFQHACRLRAGVVFGLSGSLVREDGRIARLASNVGPVLFRYHAERDMTYEVVRVPMDEEVAELVRQCRPRSKMEQALRALNPVKVATLRARLAHHGHRRSIVFCDSPRAAIELARILPGAFGPLHGGVPDAEREAMVADFSERDDGVLVASRVCDAAVDFPDGCLVFQMYISSGSRQQEVQRGGRGSRGSGQNGSHVVHLINEGTEEEGYVTRRVDHVRLLHGRHLTVHETREAPVPTEQDRRPARGLNTVTLPRVKIAKRRRAMMHG